jgi:hypothetical protein
LVGSFFQCFPGSGSLTNSVVNKQAGAVRQWLGVFAAAGVAVTVAFLAPLARHVPRASLAGLLVLAAYRMVEWCQLVFARMTRQWCLFQRSQSAQLVVHWDLEPCVVVQPRTEIERLAYAPAGVVPEVALTVFADLIDDEPGWRGTSLFRMLSGWAIQRGGPKHRMPSGSRCCALRSHRPRR